MAIPAEFQEREYESLFIQEMTRLGSFTWSPGQTDEFLLGFDGAIWINPLRLIKFGFPTPVPVSRRLFKFWLFWEPEFWRGQRLDRSLINEWQKFADDAFPRKAVNFFVQHKRPYQSSEQSASGDHWKQAYYEYKIENDQQTRLAQLENQLGATGVVTYSSAAFMRKSDLWEYADRRSIIENSNFVSPGKLTGHSRYTFIKAGHTGFANIDPTEIEDTPILERLTNTYEQSGASFSFQVKQAGKAVQQIMDEESPNGTSFYHRLVSRLFEGLDIERSEETLISAVIQTMAFNTVNSTSWAVVTAPKLQS